MVRKIILTILLGLITACSTPYQANGWRGGYTDEQLSVDSWRVTFTGNAGRDARFVMNAAMYRAAEIAQREGRPYFSVILPSTSVAGYAYINFTHLTSYRAEFMMHGLRTAQQGCPGGTGRICQVYDTQASLNDYGALIGVER